MEKCGENAASDFWNSGNQTPKFQKIILWLILELVNFSINYYICCYDNYLLNFFCCDISCIANEYNLPNNIIYYN